MPGLRVTPFELVVIEPKACEHGLALLAIPAVRQQHAANIPQYGADAVHGISSLISCGSYEAWGPSG
jgi:hypothetical protein